MALKFDNPADKISSQTTNGDLTLAGNGSGAVVVDGELGVGTDSPLELIHLYGNHATLIVQTNIDASSYLSIQDSLPTGASIDKRTNSGNSLLDLNPLPIDGTSSSTIRLFRSTNTTGQVGLRIYVGANTTSTNAFLAGSGGDTYVAFNYGNFGIRSNAFGTSAVGVVSIGNGTAPTTSPGNSVQLYAKDVSSSSELFVRDEAGNITQLSPHAAGSLEEAFPGADDKSIPLPMVIHHRNDYLAREEWIHLSKLAQDVEKLTGEQYIYHRPTEERDWEADQRAAHAEQQEKVDQWQAKKAEWEAKHESLYDDEEPRPYEVASMPEWVRDRVSQSS